MSYDESLAERVRRIVADAEDEVTERRMIGGLTFLLNGNMFAGIVGDELMVRLGQVGAEAALHNEHVREMDFTGRPMRSMVFVEPGGLNDPALDDWLSAAASFAASLPRKRR